MTVRPAQHDLERARRPRNDAPFNALVRHRNVEVELVRHSVNPVPLFSRILLGTMSSRA